MEGQVLDSNCAICREPIYHPICIDCLESRIEKWLRREAPFLLPEFKKIHSWLKSNFWDGSEGSTTCTICNQSSQLPICSYCYVREIYHHLRQFSQPVADRLTLTFDFDFQNTGYHSELEAEVENASVEVRPEELDMGICDRCENYSDSLLNIDGKAICETCRETKSFSPELRRS